MYFNVHFSFDTQMFGTTGIQNMYLQQVTMINNKMKSENTEKEINPRIIF